MSSRDFLGVSIPHRQSKNERLMFRSITPAAVSIPHRQSKNFDKQNKDVLYMEFQFLIGSLKTVLQFPGKKSNPLFQFLIGSLKTVDANYLVLGVKHVSIPHRQSKNYVDAMNINICMRGVSIPHRQSKN